jgi:hypothetical protein
MAGKLGGECTQSRYLAYLGSDVKDSRLPASGLPRNGTPTRIGQSHKAGGTNGGPSESDRNLRGRSDSMKKRDASRIILLGANAYLDKKLHMFGALDEKRKTSSLQCTQKRMNTGSKIMQESDSARACTSSTCLA